MDTQVSTPSAVATVIAVEGQAFARSPDGQMRALKPGDVLREGDTVVTLAGGHVELAFPDGHRLAVLPDESFRFTPDTTPSARPDTAEAALPAGEAERILQALERGEDIDALLDPTAAGLEGGGNNAGNDFVRLLRVVEGVDPLAFTFGSRLANVAPVFDPQGGGTAAADIEPLPVVGTLSLAAAARVDEGASIVYTATVDSAPQDSPLVLTLSNGATIIIPVGAISGSSAPVPVRVDDVHAQGTVAASVGVATADGGGYTTLNFGPSVMTDVADTADVTTVSLAATAAVAEGGSVVYTASLDHPAETALTLMLSNGAAITIPAGASSGSVSVAAPADDAHVDAGGLSAVIVSATGGNFETLVVDAAPAVTAIADTVDTTTVALTASATVAEGGSIVYSASLTSPAQTAMNVTLSNGAVITIAAGASTGSVSRAAPGDDAHVDAGAVSATIASVTGGNFENLVIDPTAATTAIVDTIDVTTVSLTASATVAEGGAIVYTASLTHPAQTTVGVALSNGFSITIPAGASSGAVSVPAPGDDVYLDAGSVSASIISASGGSFENLVIDPAAAVTAIHDTLDVSSVTLTATAAVAEGGSITYTASLTAVAQTPVSVALSNGATITIAAGAATGSVSVPASGDDVYVDATSVSATIASATGGNFESLAIDPAPATTAITDTIDTTTVSLTATPSVAEGGNIVYTASLGAPAQAPVSVSLSNGATIVIAAGASTGSIAVAAPGDDVYLDTGSVSATIAAATGGNFESLAVNPAPAITAITDTIDTTTVSLTATPSVAEGGAIVYTASLDNPAQAPVTITLSNGATIGIAAGSSTGTVSVPAPADDVHADAGSVSATITGATGGTFESLAINPAPATTTVTDTIDTTTVSLTATPSVAEGGNIIYTASLDNPAQAPVTVALSNGASITIAAGASVGTVAVAAPSDDVYLDSGSVSATIASATGGNFESLAINPAAATTAVTDTIDTTTVSLTATPSIAEGGSIVYTASLNTVAQTPVTVSLSNGAMLTIAAGAASGTVSVAAPSDDVHLDAGSVSATIASASGGNFESLFVDPAAATTAITDTIDVTTVSLTASASVAEGGSVVYTASLDHPAASPVTVTLSNGATITIAAGSSSGTTGFVAPADSVHLDAGSVSATIASASGGSFESLLVNPAAATTSIIDTIDATTVSLAATPSVAEGGNITYVASLSNAAQTPVSVVLSNGAMLTIAAGASSGNVTVAAPRDDVYLDASSVSATITSATGGNFESLAINPAAATTSVSDTLDTVTVSLSGSANVAEGGTATYLVSLTQPAQSAVTVSLAYGGTASNGVDYSGVTSVSIPAGSSSTAFSIPLPADLDLEGTETLVVSIASAAGGNFENLAINAAASSVTTSVTDSTTAATLSLNASATVAEGGSITYTASLTGPALSPMAVTLSNGAVIHIAAGASNGSVSVAAPSDDVYVDAGSVSASIASTAGGGFSVLTVDATPATTSVSDTTDAATIALTATPSVAEGGNITYTASLTHPAQTPVSVTLSNGATIAIAAGTASGSVAVAAPGDDAHLDSGLVSATIAAASGGNFESLAINPAAAVTAIADTIDSTTVSLTGDATVAEGGSIVYTASLNNLAQTPVSVTLSNGAVITIAAGASSGSVSVPAPSDDVHLDAGSVSATISSASGGNFESLAIDPAVATTTITDTIDVTTVSLSATPSVAEGGNISYTASLDHPADTPVTVTLSNGATIIIAAGASSGTASAAAPADDAHLDPSSVSATITSASGGNFERLVVDPAAATTTITDTLDVTTVSLSATPSVAEGGNITYMASLTQAAQSPVSVTLSNGASITIAAGTSGGSVSVPVPADDVYVDAGSISASIAAATGGNFESLVVDPAPATTSITDTLDTTTISLTASPSVAEGGNVTYTASLDHPAGTPVSVTLSNGATIAIAAGASGGSVSVPAPLDDVYLDAGSVSATISSVTGGNFENLVVDPAPATTSITDTLDMTTVSLTASPSVAEGGSIVYTASLDNVAQTPVTVVLSNGASLTIAAGASSGSTSVAAATEDVYLDAGSVSATITSAVGGNFESLAINPAAATSIVTDTLDVTTVSLSASASVAEGGSIVYTASLDNPAASPVTITLSNGASITIAAGTSSGNVTVAAPSDDAHLDAGSVSATIASATGGNFETLLINPAAAITSITDTLDTTTVSLAASPSVAEGGSITYTASLTGPAQTPVSVVLSNGATITIAAGAASASVSIAAPGDDGYLDGGSVSATIASAAGGNFESLAIDPAAATTAIADTIDATTVSLSANGSALEGGDIVYTASLTQAAQSPVSVTLSNGASITIAAGASSGSVSVPAPADDVYVDAGSVSATIIAATGGNFENLLIDPAAATTSITDTTDTSTVSLSADASVAEGGTVVYTASLDNPAQTPLSVVLSNGATISIAAGSSSGSVSVAAPGDDAYLDADSVSATIASATGGNFENLLIDPAAATTSITDTLNVTTVSLTASVDVAEGGYITYTASLDNPAGTPVSVTLSNGATISIAAGASSGSVSVPAPSDDVYIDAGTVSVTIASASGGNFESLVVDPAPATTSITDTIDTTTVSLTASASVSEGGNISYTASLNNVAQAPVTVTLSNGATITVAAGSATGTVNVPAPADDSYLDGGDVSVTISSASGGSFENLAIDPAPAVTTVTDTTDVTTVALTASPSVAEGGSILYTASLNSPADTPVTVTLSNGAAITIAAGASSGMVSVLAPSDDAYIDAGSVSASIASVSGGNFESLAINPAAATTAITDTVDATTLDLTASASVAEGGAVTYVASVGQPVSGSPLLVSLSNGLVISIPPGASSASVSMPAADDVYAGGSSLAVTVSGTSGANYENLVVGNGAAGSPVVTAITDDVDATTVSLTASATAAEGGNIIYTASLGNPAGAPVSVTLSNGATIGIAAGASSGSVSVPAPTDDVYVDASSVSATIVSATGGNFEALGIDPAVATTAITDTVDVTTVSLTASASVAEGGNIVYTASVNNPAGTPVSVTLSNGATITIAAGASSSSVSVPAPGDDVYIDAGSVSATISAATGGNFENLVIDPAAATTAITDTVDVTTISLTATASVAEGGTITYTASLNNPAVSPVAVTLSNGATIAIPAGASSGSVSVPAAGDDVYVGAGNVSATIVSATGGNFENLAIDPAAATTSIGDTIDITTVSLTASPSVAEGGSIVYTASLDNPAGTPLTVTLSNGATITIAAGTSSGSVSAPAPGDDVYVDAGSISATISSVAGGNFENLAVNPAAATTSITDTLDATTVSISGDGSVNEGANAHYTVSLTSPAQSAVTVNLAYGGTATDGADFSGILSVVIPSGASSTSFSLATIDDTLVEGAENFFVNIASATGGQFENLVVDTMNSSVTTTVDDNDATTISLSATPTLSEAGGSIVYTATASQPPVSDLTLTLSNGATITILAGQASGSTSVAVAPRDDVYNDAESVSASIITATGGGGMVSINATPAITTIADTLDAVTVSLSASPSVAEGGSIVYTASVDHPAQTPVTVNLSNGAMITIAGGASTGSVSVPAPADDVYTDAGSISTSITSATGGNFESLAVDPTSATTMITDTLAVTTVSLTATASVAEGGNVTYTASLDNVAQTPVSVNLSNGAVIAIAAGASTGSISVPAATDDVYLDAGSISATIASASGGNFESLAVNPAAAMTAITDTLDTTTVSLTASASVAEGGTITYTASLTSVAQTPVDVVLSNGATITIAAGASFGSVAVTAPADDVYLDAGSVSATIVSASGGNFENLSVDPAAAVTTIADTVDTTTLSLTASASVAEGGNILYTANLTSIAATPVSVTLSNGATITIAVGASSGSVSVPAPADDVYVDADVVAAVITSASGGNFENLAIDAKPATTTVSDTLAVTTVSLTATASVAEGGNITYMASLDNVAQTPVSVNLSNGAVITIAAGASNGSVSVPAPADDVYVDAGSVSATIASASGGNFENLTVNPTAAVTAIADTIDTTTVSLSADAAVAEGGSIVYTASLNNVATAPVTVTLSNGAVIAIVEGAASGSVSVAAPSDDAYLDTGAVSATIASASGGNFENLTINPAPATTSVSDTLDGTTVSLTASANVAEGGSIVYSANLTNAAQTPVTVTLSNGATITIAAGASSGSVSVPAPSDDVYVDASSISATLVSATGGNFESLAIDPLPATTAVTDTVDVATLSLTATPGVAEGGSIVYTASLTHPAGSGVTVTLSNGATIEIPAGASSGSTSVAAPTDDVYSDASSVSATISGVVGGNFESLAIDPSAATTTISDTVDTTTISLTASAGVAEGGSIVYTASLDNPAAAPVSVTLSNGAVIAIATGASTGSVSVPAPLDDAYLDAGSVAATIASATGGNFETLAIDPSAATTAISDTLDTTTVSLTASASVAEGGNIVYTASLTHPANSPVSVTLSNGAVIAIAAGASTGSVSVAAPSDDVYVDAGSISATITSAAGGNFEQLAVNASAATTTITDTLDATTLSLTGDGSVAEGASARYTVSLTSPAQSDVKVDLAYSGAAVDGADFNGTVSVTIPAGASSASFSLATLDDAIVEGGETFTVTIASASGGNFENLVVSGAANSVATSLGDNDATTLAASSPSVAEDGGYAVFTVTLSNPSSQSTSIGLALADGSATGDDYGSVLEVSTDGGVTWTASNVAILPAMQTSLLARTAVANDALDEASETFSLTATRLAGTPVTNAGGATGTATIVDDDATPSLSIDSVTVNEGAATATFTVTLSAASGRTVTVDYATADGTASSGNDYVSASGTLSFAPGTTSQTLTVPILNDAVYEGSEAFNVVLSGAINASIATATGVATILDNGAGAGGSDNDTPTLTVSSPTAAESGGHIQFTVGLGNASTSAVVFTPTLASGTALLGTDTALAATLEVSADNGATWSAVSGDVSIAAGSTSVLLRVAVNDDAVVEGTENLTLTATVIGGGTLNAAATGTASISDDDAIVVGGIAADDDDVNENRDALAGNDIVHAGVIANVATSVTLAIDDAVASGLTSNGEAIAYAWDDATRTLTASSASGTVFTVTLNAANDGYSYTQLRGVDHPAVAGEAHSITVPLTLVAQDANGVPFTSSVFNVTLLDDAPSVSASKTIVTDNDGSYVESGFLAHATVSNDVTQVSWNTTALPALVFDGKPVLYVDDGNGTLTGQLADGTLIFRASIDPTQVDAGNHPQYSFELLNTLGRLGIEDSETSYTVISGGNISNLDLGFGGYLVDSMSAVDGLGVSTTVNTNNNWIGLGGNWFNPGERLFMAFSDVSGNAGEVRGMNLLVEGQGSAPYTLNWTVTAAVDAAGNTITYSGSVPGTGNADIPFSIPLSGGALYFTNLEVSAPAGSGEFRIALSGIAANDYFSDIPLALGYTLTDADGDSVSGQLDVTLTAGNAAPFFGTAAATATVSEEGLAQAVADTAGSPDTTNATVITGSMSISDPDGPAPTVTLDWPGTPPALTAGGAAVSWSGAGTNTLVGSANGVEVVRIAIANDGNYTVTLSKAVDHTTANVEDVLAFDVQVRATDGVATTTGTLTVNIEDDSAAVGNLTQAVTVPQQDTNLMLIVDVSGSMSDPSGITGQTRLQAAKAAINQLIDSYDGLGDVAVRVVYFSTGADWSGSAWVNATTGKTQINALSANGYTNYDAALADAMTAFGHSGKIAGAQNVSYFLSDGAPNYSDGDVATLSDSSRTSRSNSDEGIQTGEETIWTNFLNTNDVKSYAIGIGTGLPSNAQTLLNPIAYDGNAAGANTNATIVTNMTQLSGVLQATVPPATTGNLLTGNIAFGSGSGADGGYMPAVTLDGTTYSFDAGAGTIAVSGSGGAGYVYDGTTHALTIATAQGGSLTIDMDDGAYAYTPSATMSGTVSETIGFSMTDADGDSSSGVLTLNVSRDGATLTGISGADALVGTAGADVISGGAGNDTLSGLLGGDTFKWNLADPGTQATPARDTILDFDSAIGSDKLDLRDLLQGESHSGTDAGNLADYLHFSYDTATSTTIVEVKSQGATMTGPDQIINLSGVDLVTGYTSDQQIIQDLLTKGKLITD